MIKKGFVIGVGHSWFGMHSDVTIQDLAFGAVKDALKDAGIEQKDVDLSVVEIWNMQINFF